MKDDSKQRAVRIDNQAGGVGFTNRNRAARFVRDCRARWTGANSIAFLTADYRHQAAVKTATRACAAGYDEVSRMLAADELRHVPVLFPWKLRARR